MLSFPDSGEWVVEFGSTWAAMLNLDHISGFTEVATSNERVCRNARCSPQPICLHLEPTSLGGDCDSYTSLERPLRETVPTPPRSRGRAARLWQPPVQVGRGEGRKSTGSVIRANI